MRPYCFTLFGMLGVLVISGCGIQSEYRKVLPPSASEVREHRTGVIDYTYHLQAVVTEAEFEAYVAQLGLMPSSERGLCSVAGIEMPKWWLEADLSAARIYTLDQSPDFKCAWYKEGKLHFSVVHI